MGSADHDAQPVRVGRPRTCDCGTCKKCKRREYMRARWQAMTPEQRRAEVARRDQDGVRRRDRKRSYKRSRRDKQNAYGRAGYERNREARLEVQRARRAAEPEKYKARTAVSNALRDGRLVRGPCERVAEGECYGQTQAHHDDYEKPLGVRWLCAKHHGELVRL